MTTTTRGGVATGHRWEVLGDVYVPPPQAPSHRSFGVTVGGVLLAIAALSLWRGHAIRAEVTGGLGALLVLGALVRPALLAPLAAAWGRLGRVLGAFNSRVLLGVMFVLVFCPVGFVLRLLGRDPLERRGTGSGWSDYPARLRDPKHYDRMF